MLTVSSHLAAASGSRLQLSDTFCTQTPWAFQSCGAVRTNPGGFSPGHFAASSYVLAGTRCSPCPTRFNESPARKQSLEASSLTNDTVAYQGLWKAVRELRSALTAKSWPLLHVHHAAELEVCCGSSPRELCYLPACSTGGRRSSTSLSQERKLPGTFTRSSSMHTTEAHPASWPKPSLRSQKMGTPAGC